MILNRYSNNHYACLTNMVIRLGDGYNPRQNTRGLLRYSHRFVFSYHGNTTGGNEVKIGNRLRCHSSSFIRLGRKWYCHCIQMSVYDNACKRYHIHKTNQITSQNHLSKAGHSVHKTRQKAFSQPWSSRGYNFHIPWPKWHRGPIQAWASPRTQVRA